MSEINWRPPEPRSGLLGEWDKFVGPGATSTEEWVQFIGGLALLALLGVVIGLNSGSLNWTAVQIVIAALLGFDIVGGIITNATSAAKRWYHREGHSGLKAHLPFVALHGVHLLVVSALFHGMDWTYFAVSYAYLMAAAALILLIPLYVQRPVAFALYAGGLLLSFYVITPAAGLEWFIPFLYFKLLISHLLKEAPYQPGAS
jgi:hypothetical protein